jgi:hypothetical protein
MPATIFAFESDFAGSLRCIPMAVRLKLDLVGIKLSLRQWSQLQKDQRTELLRANCSGSIDTQAYRDLVESMLALIADSVIERVVAVDGSAWSASAEVPTVVVRQSADKNLPAPTPAQWSQLTDVQRFALIKLTRPGHENENFVPAMQEFGLL